MWCLRMGCALQWDGENFVLAVRPVDRAELPPSAT